MPEEKDTLRHYGIIGQKWGERRYQNPDGTYTEEGLKRKRSGKKMSERTKKVLKTGAAVAGAAAVAYGIHKLDKKQNVASNKDIRNMTNEALDKYVNRLKNEKSARDLRNELYPSIGGYVGGMISKIGKNTMSQVGTSLAVALGVNYLKNYVEGIKMPTPKDQWKQ